MAASLARKLSSYVVATFGAILYGTGLVLSALTHNVTILAIGVVVVSGELIVTQRNHEVNIGRKYS